MKEAVYRIQKMDCPTEEQIIRNRLKSVEGIDGMTFDLMQRRLTVEHRLDDPKSIQAALESVGMDPVQLTGEEPEDHTHPSVVPTMERILIALSGVAAIAAEVVSWSSGQEKSWPVIALALLSIALGGRETLRKGVVALKTLTLNINFLMTLAVVGAVAIGQWPEAAMVTFLFGLAEMIEALSLDRARHAIRSLMEMSPETALVQREGQWREAKATEVEVGEVIRVRPGERVALDGEVVSGSSSVNQAPITGESMAVSKGPGDKVFAGTVNEKGSFEFRVTANTGQTALARIIKTVQQAQSEKAPTQRFVDSFAKYYTPGVVVFALLVAALPPLLFGHLFMPWLYKALVMLVIACPCALVISTPVTVVSGLAAAARRGILIKGGVYLELGRKIRLVALDKTGTLTHGAPVVTDVVPLVDDIAKERALQLAASLDAPSEHPVASAVVAAWTGAGRTPAGTTTPERIAAVERSGELLPVGGFESITGRGAKGTVEGELYFIGNHRLTEELKVCGPHVEKELFRLEAEGKTAVVLSSTKRAVAVIGVADTLRESSVEAVRQMHELGIRTAILTGDNQQTAEAIAKSVGIDDVRGDLLPEDKLTAIEALILKHGEVGMVGDGINDAPALAKASVGFAMGAAGTDTALETADVALMQDDLRKLPEFVRLSKATGSVLAQNIALALGIKVVFFALALAGVATLWMAVFADMGGSLLVVANGLRLLRHEGSATTR